MEPIEYETMARLENSYWWYLGLQHVVGTVLRSELGGERPRKILDAGCGTGGGMALLARAFPESLVVGTDVALPAIYHSAGRKAGPIVYGSVNCLPFKTGAFDVVLLIDVLNVAGVDDGMALREAWRLLRPGGLLAANVPAFEWLRGAHDAAVCTIRRYQRKELEWLLLQRGFKVKKLIYWNALLLPVVFAVRRFSLRRGRVPRSDLTPLPRSLNAFLTRVAMLDTWICTRVSMPFGTSVFGVAAKAPEV